MALKEWYHSTEIRHDYVCPKGKRHAVGELLEKVDFVRAAVGGGNLTCHLNDLIWLDGIDAARSKLAREHCENTWSRADF